jgi:hypothetical protein
MELVVSAAGLVRCIYTEAIDLSLFGQPVIRRASSVEPDEQGSWQVDLSPLQGPVVVGFATRSQALAFEVNWLRRHWLSGPSSA